MIFMIRYSVLELNSRMHYTFGILIWRLMCTSSGSNLIPMISTMMTPSTLSRGYDGIFTPTASLIGIFYWIRTFISSPNSLELPRRSPNTYSGRLLSSSLRQIARILSIRGSKLCGWLNTTSASWMLPGRQSPKSTWFRLTAMISSVLMLSGCFCLVGWGAWLVFWSRACRTF